MKAITTTIKATSRASVKVKDSFYTVEYCEEQMIPEPVREDEAFINAARKDLWDIVNNECDKQIQDILDTFNK